MSRKHSCLRQGCEQRKGWRCEDRIKAGNFRPWVSEEQPTGHPVFQFLSVPIVLLPQTLGAEASGRQGSGRGATPVGPVSFWAPPGTPVPMAALADLQSAWFSPETLAEITICFASKNLKRPLTPALYSLRAPSVMSSPDLLATPSGSLGTRLPITQTGKPRSGK